MSGDAKKLARALAALVVWYNTEEAGRFVLRVESARKLLRRIDPDALRSAEAVAKAVHED